jgi:hypothetical protein
MMAFIITDCALFLLPVYILQIEEALRYTLQIHTNQYTNSKLAQTEFWISIREVQVSNFRRDTEYSESFFRTLPVPP